MDWLQRVAESVAIDGPTARVVIVETSGPTPRATGAAMLVTAAGQRGRIGRGEVERRAITEARRLIGEVEARLSLAPVWQRQMLRFETGQVLGERSHGNIVLLLEVYAAPEVEVLRRARAGNRGELLLGRVLVSGAPAVLFGDDDAAAAELRSAWRDALRSDPRRTLARMTTAANRDVLVERIAPRLPQLSVYGTGLVARALVKLLADLPFETVWLDSTPAHFPAAVPNGVEVRAAADLSAAVREAAAGGFHAVMTASHDLDLAVCRAVVARADFAYLGVIGSRLKRERLLQCLAAEGHTEETLGRIVCPIGLPALRSKAPEVIAVAIAAQALMVAQTDAAPASGARSERASS